MAVLGSTQIFVRGATIQFATNFFDVNGVQVQPNSAMINIVPTLAPSTPITIAMSAPSGAQTKWTALWDTRNVAAPQAINWSIHTGTGSPVPVTAEDGAFNLSANPANLPTF
jgi:hypothetical protein